ncbi:MAG TPA: thioesterase family protein [Caulobacteraceae bacterium]|jgi:acyl-CoA thioesterase
MGTLQQDTAVRLEDGRYVADLSKDWDIWGPNGGYLCAIALRAAGAAAPEGHRPASMSCQFLAPAATLPVQVAIERLRSGRTVNCFNATMGQEDRAVLQAQIWTTNKSEGPSYANVPAPESLPLSALADLPDEPVDRPGAVFRNNFDRKAVGDPVADAKSGSLRRWSRYRNFQSQGDSFLDAARFLPLIDFVIFPAFAMAQPELVTYQAVTLDLSVWFHADAASTDWLLVDAYAGVAARGLIHGGARIFNEAGDLLASGASHLLHMPSRAA